MGFCIVVGVVNVVIAIPGSQQTVEGFSRGVHMG